MYYLVNNKIIKHSKKICIERYGCNNYLRFKNRSQLFEIKNQSENVFDLIEKGDLIKLDYTGYPYSEEPFTVKFVDNTIFKGIRFNKDIIIAIYKTNKKGDYIKVWEVVVDDK